MSPAKFELVDGFGNVHELVVRENGAVRACGKKTRIVMGLSNYFTGFHPGGYQGADCAVRAAARKAAEQKSTAPLAAVARAYSVRLVG